MKKKKAVLSILITWLFIFIAGIICLKNTTLTSYEKLYTAHADEINSIGYNVQGNAYLQSDSPSHLSLHFNESSFNSIQIKFEKPLKSSLNVDIYYFDEKGNYCFIQNEILNCGRKATKFNFDGIKSSNIFLDISSSTSITDNVFSLKSISICNRINNWIQFNYQWFFTIFSILTLSIVLTIMVYAIKKRMSCSECKSSLKKERESNLELLRIICMFLIIIHHCVVHGGATNINYGSQKIIALFFAPGGKICFDAFIALSMWFLVDSNFKTYRFIKIWFQSFFYSAGITFLLFWIIKGITITELLSTFLPITGNSHGFASSYLLFYLLLPFIKRGTDNLNQKQSRILLIITFYAQVCSQIIAKIDGYSQPIYCELLLFVFCYILSLNLKKWPIKILDNKWFTFSIFLSVWLFYAQTLFADNWGGNTRIIQCLRILTGDESSLLMIIAGYALFFFFKNIKIKNNKYINLIATYTFGILLIHDHNFFRNTLWHDLVMTQTWYYSDHFLLRLLICSIIIFFTCSVIEYLRQTIIETIIMQSRIIKRACIKYDVVMTSLDKVRNSET